MKHLLMTSMILALVALLMGACVPPTAPAQPSSPTQPTTAAIANPASENCIAQGGTLQIVTRGDGGQYGICYFEDNRQCEEWALLRGDCPVGGLKITGYATPAAQYCVITGGTYAITGNSGADDEQGACTLPDGGQCDAWDYYNGLCDASTSTPAEPASVTGASPALTATATSTTTMAPLKDAVATMEPQAVWQNFYDLTQVPRPSHHEEQVRAFLVQFGDNLGLETLVDGVGNVLIRKPASPGLENAQGVILQAHMDMVPQKTAESDHDFLTDPIDAFVAGDFVVADGTTLGADDGIGIAMAMAVLQEQDTPLGPIEALFTVNEEDGMDGALGLQPDLLQGSILINLDSETEGEFTIGSAGGDYVTIDATYGEVAVPDATTAYSVTVSGLQGGHSGVDIDKGRGHATKLLVRLLNPAVGEYGVRLASIAGGDAANAITREATALVVVPEDQAEAFEQTVQAFDAIVKSELSIADPGVMAQATAVALPAQIMDETEQQRVLDALYAIPQGVLRMSDAVPGLVETSTNLGIVSVEDGVISATSLPRSSVDSELDDVNQMIASVADLAGVPVTVSGRYSGWKPNPESPIVLLMQDVYREQTGQEAVVSAIHAGLECGTIVGTYPGMDAISIGPTLHDVHTPNERLEIATVPKLMDLLMVTLQRVSAQPSATTETTPAQSSVVANVAPDDMLASKDATTITQGANQALLDTLPFADQQDFEDARRGFIATLPEVVITGDDGSVVWSLAGYEFLQEQDPPPSVNPSLWRMAQLNMNNGLFMVTDRIYQVRGFDLANMTIVEGDTGLIVIDPLGSTETAQAALDLYYQERGRKPVVAVLYTHSHHDHYAGVKGVTSDEDVAAGKTVMLAPDGWLEAVVSENVFAGNAMERRAAYQYGKFLPPGATSQVELQAWERPTPTERVP